MHGKFLFFAIELVFQPNWTSRNEFVLVKYREVIFYESENHESSYDSVSGFSPKVRIRVGFKVRIGVGFSVMVGVRVRVTGVFSQVKHFNS